MACASSTKRRRRRSSAPKRPKAATLSDNDLFTRRQAKRPLEERIVDTLPVLESFGNAKTLRNDNSSRFGRYTELHFDEEDNVCGVSVDTFLLEKSRLVEQAEGERNFHIFYQMLAGLGKAEREVLGLTRAADFRYLRVGGEPTDGDKRGFAALDDSLRKHAVFRGDSVGQLWRMLSGILWLGNVAYAGGDAASVANPAAVARAAALLDVDADLLLERLTSREMPRVGRVALKAAEAACPYPAPSAQRPSRD